MEFAVQLKKLSIWRLQMDILDVGCGNGKFFQKFFKPGRNYDAVDIVDLIPDKTNLRFYKKSFTEFIPDKKYDLIFARNVFSQEPEPIKEAARYATYLKPAGIMCVSFMGDNDPWVTEGMSNGTKWYGVSRDEVVDFQKNFKILWNNEFSDKFEQADGIMKDWHWYQMILKKI